MSSNKSLKKTPTKKYDKKDRLPLARKTLLDKHLVVELAPIVVTGRLERPDSVLSGASGHGHVADFAIFPSGEVVLCWKGRGPSLEFMKSYTDMRIIHGQNGNTKFVFDNEQNCLSDNSGDYGTTAH